MIKTHMLSISALLLLVAMPSASFATGNTCPYEKAMKEENLLFLKKIMDQTPVILRILGELGAINNKRDENEGTQNSLSKEDTQQYGKLLSQYSSANAEYLLTARRAQDLDTINKFVQIAQQGFSGVAPVLTQKEIKDYTDEVKNERELPKNYDEAKIHRLFLDWFANEVLYKKIKLPDEQAEPCNLDKSLASLILEMGAQLPADDGASALHQMEAIAAKYNTPSGQHIDMSKLSISDRNAVTDLTEQALAYDRRISFISRISAIRNVNVVSEEMYNLSNEDLLKSGGSIDMVVNHDFYKDFPEEQHGTFGLLVRLNDKLPSKIISDMGKLNSSKEKTN